MTALYQVKWRFPTEYHRLTKVVKHHILGMSILVFSNDYLMKTTFG